MRKISIYIFGILLLILGSAEIQAQTAFSFTNAGATGRYGPTQNQVNTEYSGTNLAGRVTVNTQGYQEWVVPSTGTYLIEATGATGGQQSGQIFGTGATLSGEFSLTQGDVLTVVIGQQGIPSPGQWEGCGGGGGSFVVLQSGNSALLVAAGGSGGDGDGNYVNRPKPGGSSATGDPDVAGMVLPPPASAAGGGFKLNGQDGYQSTGGASYLNGAIGGTASYEGRMIAHGGFGGGGAGSYYTMGGAAGGFQGGDTEGSYGDTNGPRAALSFNAGTNQVNTDGTNQTSADFLAHGSVNITPLNVTELRAIPTLSIWGLGLLVALFGFAAFKKRLLHSKA